MSPRPFLALPVLPGPQDAIPGTETLPAGRTLLGDLLAERARLAQIAPRHLPMSRAELDERGIAQPDVVLVTGDDPGDEQGRLGVVSLAEITAVREG